MVLPQLPQLMSPCLVTLTFTNVNRQYGQVMVGTDTDLAMGISFSLVSACAQGVYAPDDQPRSVTVVLG